MPALIKDLTLGFRFISKQCKVEGNKLLKKEMREIRTYLELWFPDSGDDIDDAPSSHNLSTPPMPLNTKLFLILANDL